MHRVGRFIPREAPTTDPLPGVRSSDHRRVYENTPLKHAWDRTDNRLEPVAGQSDVAPPAVIRCDVFAVNQAVPLPLSQMHGYSCTWN